MLTSAVSLPVEDEGPTLLSCSFFSRAPGAEGVDHLQHDRSAVAGLAGRRILDFAPELGIKQIIEGLRRVLEGRGVINEVLIVVDQRLIGVVAPFDLGGGRRLEWLQQPLSLGALDERRQGDEDVGLRIRFLFRDPLDDAARTRLDILHLDASRLGEGVELRLEPAALAVVQAVCGVDRDDVGRRERRHDEGGGNKQCAQQGFHGGALLSAKPIRHHYARSLAFL